MMRTVPKFGGPFIPIPQQQLGICRYGLDSGKLLYVVQYERVDALVEVEEIVLAVFPHGVGVLHHEEVGREVKHAHPRVELLGACPDGVEQVGLSAAARSPEEQGVERLGRLVGHGFAYGAGQAVAASFDKVVEVVSRFEVGVDVGQGGLRVLRQHGRLVGLAAGGAEGGLRHGIRLHRHPFAEARVDACVVEKARPGAYHFLERCLDDGHVVLFEKFAEEGRRHLQVERALILFVIIRNDGLEPGMESRLLHVVADEVEAAAPQFLSFVRR